jgi:large subunit ribosomal protein L13
MPQTRTTRSLTADEARAGRRWFIADAQGQTLGRLATRIASTLRGKNRPSFTPHMDTGDFVVVVNAAGIRLTGKKLTDKQYIRHTGWPGGIRCASAAEVLAKDPRRLIQEAVEGMLPKNRLGRKLATKLKVYAGADHPHQAQKPIPLV